MFLSVKQRLIITSLTLPCPPVCFKKLNSLPNVMFCPSLYYWTILKGTTLAFAKTIKHCASQGRRSNYILVTY